MTFNNNLIIKKITLNKEIIKSYDIYPFNIPAIRNLEELEIDSPVTFLIGENGTGKSTLIEAIAVALGLPSEGGTKNFKFETKNTTSKLSDFITISKYHYPKMEFFLRAESFYNFSTEVQRIAEENGFPELYNYYGGNLHECSHGESFLKLVQNKFVDHGLYIIDEPEAALSPQRQLSLLCLIDDLVKKGSQFIIATHSPILISYRNGKILDMSQNFKVVKYQETEIYSIYKMYLERPDEMQSRLFD